MSIWDAPLIAGLITILPKIFLYSAFPNLILEPRQSEDFGTEGTGALQKKKPKLHGFYRRKNRR